MFNKIVLFVVIWGMGNALLHAEGINFSDWTESGQAKWEISNETLKSSGGIGFMVAPNEYSDFDLKVDFRTSQRANSGIFIRCNDLSDINDKTCYEVNIFDHRPDPSGRTGAIVHVAPPKVSINTEGGWNTYEISARGDHLVVKLNGIETVNIRDSKFSRGGIALQSYAGEVEFKNLSIQRELNYSKQIKGDWKLEEFFIVDASQQKRTWCEGAWGTISYGEVLMSVSINCQSNKDSIVFYSGPYEVRNTEVDHNVMNAHSSALIKTLTRRISMRDENSLDLTGPFGVGEKAVVRWSRIE